MAVVLCIDKRQPNRVAERMLLETGGHQVLTAADCEEARRVLNAQPAEVVLVSDDPAQDDSETCHQVRELQPHARIVLQKAAFGNDREPVGADVVIAKTTHPQDKLRIIQMLVAKKAA